MRQRTLWSYFKNNACENTTSSNLEVYDIFCGAGGFSTGARDAGCQVVFACDHDKRALKTHALNHPNAIHYCCEMPCEIPLPTDGRSFHIHGSPPCQMLSIANRLSRSKGDSHSSVDLVEWFVNLAINSGATSWSMEQVAHRQVIELLEKMRLNNQSHISYAIFNFEKLGIPQRRRRLIAGTPRLISKLLCESESQPIRSVKDVIAQPRGTHVRGSTATFVKKVIDKHGNKRIVYTKAKWTDFCRSIERTGPTVLAGLLLMWVKGDGEGKNRSRLTPSEIAALQTFPPTYKFPKNKQLACLQIGNAVPPRVAELMLR
jgi:DNA (cytosine-5)-methyltransferase 1